MTAGYTAHNTAQTAQSVFQEIEQKNHLHNQSTHIQKITSGQFSLRTQGLLKSHRQQVNKITFQTRAREERKKEEKENIKKNKNACKNVSSCAPTRSSGPCKNPNATPSHAETNTNCKQFFEGNCNIWRQGSDFGKRRELCVRKHCEVCHMTPEHP